MCVCLGGGDVVVVVQWMRMIYLPCKCMFSPSSPALVSTTPLITPVTLVPPHLHRPICFSCILSLSHTVYVLSLTHTQFMYSLSHTQFKFQYIAENEGSNSVTVEFSRRTEQMPPVPKVV